MDQMVRGDGPQLDGQRSSTQPVELVGVDFEGKSERAGCLKDDPRLGEVERPDLAEYIHERQWAPRRIFEPPALEPWQHLAGDHGNVIVAPFCILCRNGV